MKEARTAYQLLETIEQLSDLLWDRYGDQLIQIHCEEEQNQPRGHDPLDPFADELEEDSPEKTT